MRRTALCPLVLCKFSSKNTLRLFAELIHNRNEMLGMSRDMRTLEVNYKYQYSRMLDMEGVVKAMRSEVVKVVKDLREDMRDRGIFVRGEFGNAGPVRRDQFGIPTGHRGEHPPPPGGGPGRGERERDGGFSGGSEDDDRYDDPPDHRVDPQEIKKSG